MGRDNMHNATNTRPGRGAACSRRSEASSGTLLRRTGTQSMDPGSATQHAARAARCAASGERYGLRLEGWTKTKMLPRLRILAARMRPSCSRKPPSRIEGAGNAGCAARTRSLACEIKKHTSVVTTGTPTSTGIPRAMVLTVSFALSPVTGLSCHRRSRGVSGPLGPTSPVRKLDASVGASGPHDFAVRACAARLASQPASTASRSNVRDDAYAPLIEAGRGES
jgi:hypothetical protein